MKRVVTYLVLFFAVALPACTRLPSTPTENMFVARSVLPAEGAVLDIHAGASIVISGAVAVTPGMYSTMVYVWDDGRVFLPGMWGPAGENSQWDNRAYTQDVKLGGHATAHAFAAFCSGHTIVKAVFMTSNTDILQHASLNDPGLYLFTKFNFEIADRLVDIPLNYTCSS